MLFSEMRKVYPSFYKALDMMALDNGGYLQGGFYLRLSEEAISGVDSFLELLGTDSERFESLVCGDESEQRAIVIESGDVAQRTLDILGRLFDGDLGLGDYNARWCSPR